LNTAVLITLIIVVGVVIVSVTGIGWLWYATARGMSGVFRGGGSALGRVESLEREVKELQREVGELKGKAG
jgi:hypothetical protein